MANRIRNERLEIKLTEEEKTLFEEKRKLAKCRNMSHFIRKCVLEKEIYQVDLEPFRNLQDLLSNATNNINQIAKRVNSTGVIYKEDINDMKKQIEHFSKEPVRILNKRLIGNKAISSIHLIGCRSFLLNHFEVSQSIHNNFLFFRCALWNNLFLIF